MSNRLTHLLLLALFSSLNFMGCDSGEKDNSTVIPIKGDPMAFVKGTKMDTSQGLEVDTKEETLWRITLRAFVTEAQELPATSQAALENKNKGMTAEEVKKNISQTSPAFYFNKTDNGYILKTDSSEIFKLHFKQNEGKIYFDFLSYKSEVIKNNSSGLTALHYSASPSGDKFSILFKGKDQTGPFVVSYTFDTIEEKTFNLPQVLDEAYIYLMGEGVKMSWPQDKALEISNCKSGSDRLDQITQDGINTWQEPLSGRLEIQSKIVEKCPPFSDVNTVGVYHVKEWIEIIGDAGRPAFVIPLFDLDKNSFVDSDMFFLHEEYNEAIKSFELTDEQLLANAGFKTNFQSTSAHETGHILGLAHQFEGKKSIMSYQKDRKSTLEEYDIEAIQELYPLK